jgi:hypothetical protein
VVLLVGLVVGGGGVGVGVGVEVEVEVAVATASRNLYGTLGFALRSASGRRPS